jgi:hypothetical protein
MLAFDASWSRTVDVRLVGSVQVDNEETTTLAADWSAIYNLVSLQH